MKLIQKGFSPYICFGKYGGFKYFNDNMTRRVILGYFSFGYWKCDIEETVSNLIKGAILLKKKLEAL